MSRDRREFHRKALAKAVRDARDRQLPRWSQEKLAEAMDAPLRTVQRLERGQVPAELDLCERLAEAFGGTIFEFTASLFTMDPAFMADHAAEMNRLAMVEYARDLGRRVRRPEIRRLLEASLQLTDVDLRDLTWWTEQLAAFRRPGGLTIPGTSRPSPQPRPAASSGSHASKGRG
jgi:transcriptional regulator with XRE-family HTH domain